MTYLKQKHDETHRWNYTTPTETFTTLIKCAYVMASSAEVLKVVDVLGDTFYFWHAIIYYYYSVKAKVAKTPNPNQFQMYLHLFFFAILCCCCCLLLTWTTDWKRCYSFQWDVMGFTSKAVSSLRYRQLKRISSNRSGIIPLDRKTNKINYFKCFFICCALCHARNSW